MVINGKEYKLPEINFNAVCELEEKGVSLLEIEKKPLTVIRGFLAYIMGTDEVTAGRELEQHLVNGGNLMGPLESIMEMVEKSDFFQQLTNEGA